MKKVLPWLATILIVAVGFALWTEIRGQRSDLAALKAADEKAQAAIAEKEAANQLLIAENIVLKERDAAFEAARKRLVADLAAKTIENDKLRNDLKTAPPETVLAQTQGWLDTREIWLRTNAASQTEAVFSLAAFRKNADALAEWEFLKLARIPSMELQLKAADEQDSIKSGLIMNFEQMLQNAMFIIDQKDDQLNARDETIFAIKKRNFWRTVGFVAGSFAIGYIVHGK